MLEFFQDFILPLFFQTDEKNKIVNKMTLTVTREVVSYIETEEGEIKKEISRYQSPPTNVYEGKVTVDPHTIREILSDPLRYPQKDPESLEKAIVFEQKDMISSLYDMVSTTMENLKSSSQILLNSAGMFFGGGF